MPSRSWQDAYDAVSAVVVRARNREPDSGGSKTNKVAQIFEQPSIVAFLKDRAASRCLLSAFEPFPPPSPITKAELEKLTSAVNASCGQKVPYDIKQVKDDTLWLANEAKVEETAALRIAVLEWQLRPRDRLLWSDPDGVASAADTTMGASFNGSASFSQSFLAEVRATDGTFETDHARRARLLRLYLRERLHVLRLADLLIRFYMDHGSSKERTPQLLETGKALFSAICKTEARAIKHESCVHEFVGALQQRINRIESGSGWYAKEGGSDPLELAWSQAQVDEMVPILQLTLSVIYKAIPSSKSTLSYFELMKERHFFDFSLVSRLYQTCIANSDSPDSSKILPS
jgi:nuclear pore complex protein Nup188